MPTRLLWTLMAAVAALCAGCSAWIAQSGQDVSPLETKTLVHQTFGQPCCVGTAEGACFEEFRSRKKLSEPLRAQSMGMAVIMTYGLGEFVAFPYEVGRLAWHTVLGERIRVSYDAYGQVTEIQLDGERVGMLPFANKKTSDANAGEHAPGTATQASLGSPE